MKLAERLGFEPRVGYKPTHAFQACALNHSAISPTIHYQWFTDSDLCPALQSDTAFRETRLDQTKRSLAENADAEPGSLQTITKGIRTDARQEQAHSPSALTRQKAKLCDPACDIRVDGSSVPFRHL